MSRIFLFSLDAFSLDVLRPHELSLWLLCERAHLYLTDTHFSFLLLYIHHASSTSNVHTLALA